MAYFYVVTDKATKKKRKIEAGSPANAIAHCAKDSFEATRITQDIADLIDLPLEKVTPEKKPDAEAE